MDIELSYEYVIWDMSLMLQLICLAYIIHNLIPNSKIGSRIFSFALLIISMCNTTIYILKLFAEHYEYYYTINSLTMLVYAGFIIPILINMFKPIKRISDQYKPSDSYIVYKKGGSKLNLLFGQSFIVCKGMKYYYKGGVLTKTYYSSNAKKNKNNVYERINLNQEKIDKLIGSRWGFSRNCYSLNERMCNI